MSTFQRLLDRRPAPTPTTSPFIVYALPRSRTFWLSKFLTFGGWTCEHDHAIRLRGLDDIHSALQTPLTGYVETAAAPWWRLVQAIRPDMRTVVVRRPIEECLASLVTSCGTTFDEARVRRDLTRLDAKLDQIAARVPGALQVSFADLEAEATCARVFEHCLGVEHDPSRWADLAPLKLTINFPALVRYCEANRAQLARLAQTARQRVLADLGRRMVASDAMTFQQEPFSVFLRDGRHLFAQHHVRVGKPPDEIDRMNTGLMQRLYDLGCLQVTTARSNGRMFGYLMTIIAPSLEAPDKIEALNTAFFAEPAAPGIGMKLQRSAIAAARERGADVIYLRAGTRGSGPRLGTLYQRLGAEPFGELYQLELGAP